MGSGVLAIRLDVGATRPFQRDGASVRAAVRLPLRKQTEEVFDLSDPGRAGWGEVVMESGTTGVPGGEGGRLEGASVVPNEVTV